MACSALHSFNTILWFQSQQREQGEDDNSEEVSTPSYGFAEDIKDLLVSAAVFQHHPMVSLVATEPLTVNELMFQHHPMVSYMYRLPGGRVLALFQHHPMVSRTRRPRPKNSFNTILWFRKQSR